MIGHNSIVVLIEGGCTVKLATFTSSVRDISDLVKKEAAVHWCGVPLYREGGRLVSRLHGGRSKPLQCVG
ncbi:hypothetical protein [Rubritalea tangerina]|uniref:hypothetical protein n=1 Tax=Rubritalea tangerina TaxID=430798 RepID=UPI0036102551